MRRRIVELALMCLCAGQIGVQAQEFKVFDRTVQFHGFASQGFVYTNQNNWLTMHSSQGSGAFTDFGANASMQVTDKLRVGAQFYDRNLGNLGEWHPSLDWAFADYRFKPWLGIRGGKVKTALGLYNDTQDLDFLHTFALLPQSIYPTDLRDATIAHLGGDIYGSVSLRHHLGTISYTAYAGHRSDSMHSGYPYLLSQHQTYFDTYGGLQYGGDLRWNTPVSGFLVGASRMNEDITGKGLTINPFNPGAGLLPYSEFSKADWTNQFYGEYAAGKLRIDAEYRRYVRDQLIFGGTSANLTDVRGWYVAGAYRVAKRLEFGSYYSCYAITSVIWGPLAALAPNQTDTSLPANHIYDQVVTARIDLNKFWNIKIGNGVGKSVFLPPMLPALIATQLPNHDKDGLKQ